MRIVSLTTKLPFAGRPTLGLVRLRPPRVTMNDAVRMSLETSEDSMALSADVADAARVLIYDAGCLQYAEQGEDPRDEILSEDLILTVAGTVAVTAVTDVVRMCLGTVSMELLEASGERLTMVSLHHGTGLRWSGWSGDAELADGPGLLALLSKLGYDGPTTGSWAGLNL